jgi:membrane-associated phospholipid phosphatase
MKSHVDLSYLFNATASTLVHSSFSQSTCVNESCRPAAPDIKIIMQYLSSVPSLPRRKLLWISVITLGTALMCVFFVDQPLSLFFKQPEMMQVWLMARTITNVGLSIHYFVGTVLIYVISRWWLKQWAELRTWSRDFFFALVVTGITVNVTKMVVGRQRPHISEGLSAHVFHPLTFNWDFQSFPSGHSQVMFTVATMMSLGFPRGKWIFFLLAAFFAFTRVITRDHFLSDVISGALLGYGGTLWAVYWLHYRLRPELRA